MTAVEWLWNALLLSGFEEIKNVEGFYHLAKQKDIEQRQSEYTRGFDDGCQRKQQELDHLRGKNHSCQDNFKNPFKNEPKEQ